MFTQYVRDYDGSVGVYFVIICYLTEHINQHKPQCLRKYTESIHQTAADTTELSQVRTTMQLHSISCH